MSKSNESKTVKEALKEARENIDKKDFKTALKCCKRALNVDKTNYMALVYCGLCLAEVDQPEQALKAYQKATENHPEQITAWQGLASFYEKQKVNKNEDLENLVQVYDKLLEFFEASNDERKYFGTSEKSVNICQSKLQNVDKVIETLEARNLFSKKIGKEDKIYHTNSEIIRALGQIAGGNLTENQTQKLKDSLYQVISETSTTIQNSEHMKTLIRLLYKLREMEKLLNLAFLMNSLFPDVSFALEWICKVYLEYVTDSLDFKNEQLENNIETHIEKLLIMNNASTLGRLAQAAFIWHSKEDNKQSSKLLSEILDGSTSPNFYGLYILSQTQLALSNFDRAENSLTLALAVLTEKVKDQATRQKLEKIMKKNLSRCAYAQGKFVKAIEALENINDDDKYDILIKSFAHLGMEDKVQDLLDQVSDSDRYFSLAILSFKSKENSQEALDYLSKIDGNNNMFEATLLKGQIYWESGLNQNLDLAHQAFLLAAKGNPHSWLPFFYLGEFYKHPGHSKQNLDQARKCYQKSFSLNPQSSKAGPALSDILRVQGKFEENLNLLNSVSSKGQSWANLRLGMHYLAVDEPSKAIISLQNVLRTDGNHLNAWESLADAYFNRGSYTSALKAYDKVLTLVSSDEGHVLYPQLQIATIKLKLGFYRDAKLALKNLLQLNEKYVPALKVMAECLLNESREYLLQAIDKNVVDNCQDAVIYLVTAIQESSKSTTSFGCIWKLLGEALLLMNALPQDIAKLKVPFILLDQTTTAGDDKDDNKNEKFCEINKLQALKLASKALTRALNLQPENVACWQDLALSFHYRILQNEKNESEKDTTTTNNNNLKMKSFTTIRKALALDPKNSDLWNILGVFSAYHQDFALGQHAFIKSVSLQSNATAWSNLGMLYLTQGRMDLANKAFKEGQNQDPAYIQAWIGQALIAEASGMDNEAIDLFRHCNFLGMALESSIGFGHWICKTLREMAGATGNGSEDDKNVNNEKWRKKHTIYCVNNMFGVTVASDCLLHYVNRVPDDTCALNMLGILLERERHYRSAKKMFARALKLRLEPVSLSDQVLQNLARVLYKLEEFEASIKCYHKMATHDFYSQVGLALASLKAEKFEDGYSAYGAALQLAQEPAQRSHVLTAMATIAFKFQGPDAAKTLLFQSCQQRPPSLQGILALCVLGLQQSNSTLVQAALSEMNNHKDHDTKSDIVAMKSLVVTLQGDATAAQRMISKAIHQRPDDPGLWKVMATHLLNYHGSTLSGSASRCAQKSAGLCMQEAKGHSNIHNSSNSVEMMSLVGLCLLPVDKKAAYKDAIKAVHCYPERLEPWCVLLKANEGGEGAKVEGGGNKEQQYQRVLSQAKAVMSNHCSNKPLMAWVDQQ